MTSFEWFLLIVVVIVVPLTVAVVVTLWTIDQANKRKRANRSDPQIGVKRQAALSPEEAAARKASRAEAAAIDPLSSPGTTPSTVPDVETPVATGTTNGTGEEPHRHQPDTRYAVTPDAQNTVN